MSLFSKEKTVDERNISRFIENWWVPNNVVQISANPDNPLYQKISDENWMETFLRPGIEVLGERYIVQSIATILSEDYQIPVVDSLLVVVEPK